MFVDDTTLEANTLCSEVARVVDRRGLVLRGIPRLDHHIPFLASDMSLGSESRSNILTAVYTSSFCPPAPKTGSFHIIPTPASAKSLSSFAGWTIANTIADDSMMNGVHKCSKGGDARDDQCVLELYQLLERHTDVTSVNIYTSPAVNIRLPPHITNLQIATSAEELKIPDTVEHCALVAMNATRVDTNGHLSGCIPANCKVTCKSLTCVTCFRRFACYSS